VALITGGLGNAVGTASAVVNKSVEGFVRYLIVGALTLGVSGVSTAITDTIYDQEWSWERTLKSGIFDLAMVWLAMGLKDAGKAANAAEGTDAVKTANVAEGAGEIQVKEVVPPGSNHAVEVYTDGYAQINRGKIDTYMRGKVELDIDLAQARIDELKAIQKNQPDIFNKSMKTELKSLNSQVHNYQRSLEMSKTLNNAGIVDTVENNQMITENLLEAAKKVEIGSTEIISYLSGPNGDVQVVSRWKILDDETPYLATIILKPVK